MGYYVNQNDKFCYNGEPAAKYLKLNQAKTGWKKNKGVSVLDLGFWGSAKLIFSNLKYLGIFFFYFSIIIGFIYLFYLFNVWQVKLDRKYKLEKER